MKRLFAAVLLARAAFGATQVRDTIYTSFPDVLFSGRIVISAPSMTTPDNRTVLRWERSYLITDGILAVDLEPNDTATPAGTSYQVVYHPRSTRHRHLAALKVRVPREKPIVPSVVPVWAGANVQEREGTHPLLAVLQHRFSRLRLIWADQAYTGDRAAWVWA